MVAIDGPSGSGKSTVARQVAQGFGIRYADTGAMYRALTWWCLEQGIDVHDRDAVTAALDTVALSLGTDPADPTIKVAGFDISEAIRHTRVSEAVSAIATNLAVRDRMVTWQRELIEQACTDGSTQFQPGMVVEGRDITTVVAPAAPVRLLITASEQARLARRAQQLHGAADAENLASVHDSVVRRDRDDATVAEFTQAADGVVTIDTSAMTLPEVVQVVITMTTSETGRTPLTETHGDPS
ncbi:MAG: (d)CMP kinase [Angustibacter sp.]